MKIELVINEEPDGRKFLNYWDWYHGNDVCCEVIDGKLFKGDREITLLEFIELVKRSVNDL